MFVHLRKMEERPSINHQTLYFLALVNVNVNVPFKLHSQGRQGKPSGSGPKSRESEFCKRAGQIIDPAMMGSQGPKSAVSMILSEVQCSRFRNSATVQNGRSEVIFGLFGVWN